VRRLAAALALAALASAVSADASWTGRPIGLTPKDVGAPGACVAWVQADRGLALNTSITPPGVATWIDQTAYGNNFTQGTSSTQFQISRPTSPATVPLPNREWALGSQGTTTNLSTMQAAVNLTAPFSVVIVSYVTTFTSSQLWLSLGSGLLGIIGDTCGSSYQLAFYINGTEICPGVTTTMVEVMYSLTDDGTHVYGFVNEKQYGPVAHSSQLNNWRIGASTGMADFIDAVAVYKVALTQAQVAQLYVGWAKRWVLSP
jgi:hypothetical protein